ncbi:MAG: hypothetical protein COV45_04825 [Deltaproteobacteria bacterium CG11_big_fil_rev_8_21_14_0_20_47_16]|nr:MAG: hypothetical protein COV45_04825 [Deltaproteobacteria bacterium CG11_big_fil_rev_8_21_14_0_20_47_16]
MKALRILLIVGLMGAVAIPAFAQDTGGVTTPTAGYDGGFFIQNPDGDARFKFNGRIQPEYFYQQGGYQTSGVPMDAINSFRLRRALLNFSGNVTKDWSFSTFILNQTANSSTTPSNLSWGASVTYNPIPLFNLEMGTLSVPFDRFGDVSSKNYMFTEASIIVTEDFGINDLSPSRPAFGMANSVGLTIGGNWKDRLVYAVGVTNGGNPNGNASYVLNYNKRMTVGARLQWNILKDPGSSEMDLAWSETPALAIGAGGAYEDQGVVDAYVASLFQRYNIQGTGDITFKYKGLSVIAAWYGRIQYDYQTGTNIGLNYQDAGYYALVGYFVIPRKLEIGARSSQMFREGPNNNQNAYEGTINWYIIGNTLKWQTTGGMYLNYDVNVGTGAVGLYNTDVHRRYRIWSMLTLNI